MFNCCSHGTLLHFGLQSSRLNICYYHQDLHLRRLHPGPRPRLQGSPQRPSYSSRRSVRGGGFPAAAPRGAGEGGRERGARARAGDGRERPPAATPATHPPDPHPPRPRRPRATARPAPVPLARCSDCRRRPGMGPTLQRHPFSGLVDSAGELLHTP